MPVWFSSRSYSGCPAYSCRNAVNGSTREGAWQGSNWPQPLPNQERSPPGKREWVRGGDAEHSVKDPSHASAPDQGKCNAHKRQASSLTDDKPEHVEGSRAERDANPDLLRPPLKGVCQHRVDSYGCQHERRGCKDRAADNAVVAGSVAESPNSIPKASGETQSATRTPTETPTTTSHISFPRDHPQDAARSRPECHPDTNLRGPSPYQIGHQAIKTNRGRQESQSAEIMWRARRSSAPASGTCPHAPSVSE